MRQIRSGGMGGCLSGVCLPARLHAQEGRTPLDKARANGHTAVVELLEGVRVRAPLLINAPLSAPCTQPANARFCHAPHSALMHAGAADGLYLIATVSISSPSDPHLIPI